MRHGDLIDLNTEAGRATARQYGLPVPEEPQATGAGYQEAAPGCEAAGKDARGPSEKEFQAKVVACAKAGRWKSFHTYDSRRSEPGFPDWTFVRERVIFVELKAEGGRQTKAQKEWHHALLNAGAEVYCWRPSDWPQIEEKLA